MMYLNILLSDNSITCSFAYHVLSMEAKFMIIPKLFYSHVPDGTLQ